MALVMFRIYCNNYNDKNGYKLLRKTVPPPPPVDFEESKLMYRILIIFNAVLSGELINNVFPVSRLYAMG
jgi:hypothetical protein